MIIFVITVYYSAMVVLDMPEIHILYTKTYLCY